MDCHLRLEYLRSHLQCPINALLRATEHDRIVWQSRICWYDRCGRDGAILEQVSEPENSPCRKTPTFPIMHPLPSNAPTSITLPSPTSAASTTAFDSTTTFVPSTVPSPLNESLVLVLFRDEAMLLRLLSASVSAPMPNPTFARSYTTHPSPRTTGASALLIRL